MRKYIVVIFSIVIISIITFANAQEIVPPPITPDPDPVPDPIIEPIPAPKPDPIPLPGEKEKTIDEVLEENEKLKAEIKEKKTEIEFLHNQIEQIKKRIADLQAIIMEQIKVILNTLANLKENR